MMNAMELYHLQTFVIVANEGSITKASKRLNLTSPTISGHIKMLEDHLLIRLFERKPNGMVLTPEGQLLKK